MKQPNALQEDLGTDIIMLQKCAILGLILLLVGGYAYWRVYNEMRADEALAQDSGEPNALGPEEYIAKYGRWHSLTPEQQNQLVLEIDKERHNKTPEQLAKEQQARLRVDRDKLAAGEMNPGDIADFLYGHGWQDEVERYKKTQEQTEITQTIATVCLAIGGTLFGLCVVIGVPWLLVRLVRFLRRRVQAESDEPEPKIPELTDIDHEAPPSGEDADAEPTPQERPKQRRRVLALSETPGEAHASGAAPAEPTAVDELLSNAFSRHAAEGRPSFGAQSAAEESAVAVLITDEQSAEKSWSAETQWAAQVSFDPATEVVPHSHKALEESTDSTPSLADQAAVVENTLKEQAEDLQKQIAAFKQAAQDVQQTTRQQSEPLTSTLKELAQQVSAIRDYAASQQDRVEKLQDGYDWGIIRAFGLKVIRCLDNLEGRVARLSDDDSAVQHLEEIRDELLFALESSGIEQFRPEVNSEYRGQEKLAETMKEKEPTQAPDQAGKIAKVIRPGYRYMIDDDNYKVVRAAQVKLFG